MNDDVSAHGPVGPDAPLHDLWFHPSARTWVARWSGRFRLRECAAPPQSDSPLLWAAPDHLELRLGTDHERRERSTLSSNGAWVRVDDVRGRARQVPELLRACGLRRGMRVLDAMAGWGLDGMVLAAAGGRVTMVEREPLLQALQEDLIRRCVGEQLGRERVTDEAVESILGDGLDRLCADTAYDVIYLDPMFPERNKRALPNKRMQYLATLVTDGPGDPPFDEWIERARAAATHRVVVKRRAHDAAARPPEWQIRGRSIRYDVYRGVADLRELSVPAAPRSESPDR
jgi:16S rRNA (guanine1516-N2)-methyltransferase